MKKNKLISFYLAVAIILLPIIYLSVLNTTRVSQPANPSISTQATVVEITQATVIPPEIETTAPTETIVNETQAKRRPQKQSENYEYYGRLCVPDAKISVGLYFGNNAKITDREDSANIGVLREFDGLYIADHSTQEFSKLFNIEVGMRGYIQFADGKTNIECVDIFYGHNTGENIIDEEGNKNFDADYLMYTCHNSQKNILICLWKHI